MWRHFIDVAAGLPTNNGRVNFEGFRDTLARVGITGLPDADLLALFAIADEDLERSNERKTSAVHFLRFQLDSITIGALKRGEPLAMGIAHDSYRHEVSPVSLETCAALVADLA